MHLIARRLRLSNIRSNSVIDRPAICSLGGIGTAAIDCRSFAGPGMRNGDVAYSVLGRHVRPAEVEK